MNGSVPLRVWVNGAPVAGVTARVVAQPEDVAFVQYTDCNAIDPLRTRTLSGWSLATVLDAAGVPAATTDAVAVTSDVRGIPATIVLHPSDVDRALSGGLDLENGNPALFTSNLLAQPALVAFFRPFRGSSCATDDDLATQGLRTPISGPFSIHIDAGPVLSVLPTATPPNPAKGAVVSFSAAITNPPAGPVTYSWSFGDGTPPTDPSVSSTVTHAFSAAGTYVAKVTALGPSRSGGVASLPIRVGRVAGDPGHGGTTTPTSSPPTAGGTMGDTSGVSAPGRAVNSTPAPVRPTVATESTGVWVTGLRVTRTDRAPQATDPKATVIRALGPHGTEVPSGGTGVLAVVMVALALALVGLGVVVEWRGRMRHRLGRQEAS